MAEIPDSETACLDAIRHARSLTWLAARAVMRSGYGDGDGGFGLQYPEDLDEYQREVEGDFIPPGSVRIYGFWGPPDGYEVLVPEVEFLTILLQKLTKAGLDADAIRVRCLIYPRPSGAEDK